MATQGPSPALFFDTISAYQRTEALRAAIELDLFSHVGRRAPARRTSSPGRARRRRGASASWRTTSPSSASSASTATATSSRPTRRSSSTASRRPTWGTRREFLLSPDLRESFQQLTAAVRRGGTAVSDEGTVSHDNPIWVEFARAMAPLMRMPAQLLADLVGGDRGQPLRVLDVAAGHGLFGITVAEALPPRPTSRRSTGRTCWRSRRRTRARAGVADRYALLPGSAFDVDWGGPYDVVLLTNFLHHFDVPTCEQLAAKALRGPRAGRPGPDAGVHPRARPRHARRRRPASRW